MANTVHVSSEDLDKAISEIPASGPLPYRLTNDYMFRAILQMNQTVLTHLVSVLAEIPFDSIKKITIENPIVLGEHMEDKDCILDLKILLNNDTRINLEMQVGNLSNWAKRSIYYLCRMYAALKKGEDYNSALRSIHIGILTNPLFPEDHQFYSQNYLMDTKTHRLYTGNFGIHVLDLSQIDNATEEERNSPLYYWARLFLARTWEEVNAMSEKSDVFKSVACSLKELSEDEKIRLQCEARERYYADKKADISAGYTSGKKDTLNTAKQIYIALKERNRLDEYVRALTDDTFRQSLLQELNIL